MSDAEKQHTYPSYNMLQECLMQRSNIYRGALRGLTQTKNCVLLNL